MTEWLTPEQAAGLLPFGTATWVRQQLQRGALEGSKIGGRWLTTAEAVEAMVAAGSNNTARQRPRRRRVIRT